MNHTHVYTIVYQGIRHGLLGLGFLGLHIRNTYIPMHNAEGWKLENSAKHLYNCFEVWGVHSLHITPKVVCGFS